MKRHDRRRAADRSFLLGLAVVALLGFARVVWSDEPTRGAVERGSSAATPDRGSPREVEIDRVRQRIREGRLSDREADYYRVLEPATDPSAAAAEQPR
ncbi:MAG: hypothetical protein JRI23_19055 [Deltaproteobacteria bacterium]|jgi:hypothetical protein|nr:hypothetical protein [Deltaproteobacteria bacterium]MBW2533964.1 hypothetical protein [Deltaproteobacteria bacterium]